MRSLVQLAATMAVALLLLLPAVASAAPPIDSDAPSWVTDGSVQAFARDGQTLYLGGDFTRISPRTGAMLTVDGDGATLSQPEVDGDINASTGDGNGGVFIAGSFDAVGGAPRSGLAHLLPDGTLDPAFVPPAISGGISALAVSGTTLFVGGGITSVGSTARNNLAALDATTGALKPFNQGVRGFSDSVSTLLVNGTTLYVGGSFSCSGVFNADNDCNDAGETHLGMLVSMSTTANAGAGAVNTGFAPEPNQTVSALAFDASLSRLYLGGGFQCLPDVGDDQECDDAGETTRRGIAAVNPTTGALVSAFSADVSAPGTSGGVSALAIDGTDLLLGGSFTCIKSNGDSDCSDAGELVRQRLARVSLTTGAVNASWQPSANGTVRALDASGDALWVGGTFTTVGGQPRSNLALLADDAAGTLSPIDPGPNGPVETIEGQAAPARVLVGGDFRGAGGVKRGGLAAIDLQTGRPTDWAPDAGPSAQIRALALQGSTVYVGGSFASLGSQPRMNLGAVDAGSGAVLPWNPQANASVVALVASGPAVYAGGYFSTIGSNAGAAQLAKIDGATGVSDSAFPSTGGYVSALAIQGSTLYAVGGFGHIGSAVRSNAGAVDLTTDTPTAWNPMLNNVASALATTPDRVFVGGAFSSLKNGTVTRNSVVAVDPTDGVVVPGWDAHAQSTPTNALAVDGADLYVGTAGWSLYGTTPTRGLARLAVADGTVRADWTPAVDSAVLAVSATGDAVAAGGYFRTVGDHGQAGFATFTPAAESLTAPVVTGTAAVGGTLSCSTGGWRGNPLLARTWLRNGAAIPGAAAEAYAVTAQDAGQSIACQVGGTTIRGSAIATSNAVTIPSGVVPPPPPGPPVPPTNRLTFAAVTGKSVKATTPTGTFVVTYPADVTLRGTSTTGSGPAARAKIKTSRRFEASAVSTTLGTLTSDARGAFSTKIKKPTRNVRYSATGPGGTASVTLKVAPALKSKTRTKQAGSKVTLAGTIRLPTLKKAGSLVVERKSGRKYKKLKTFKSFSRGTFSLKTAQAKGTTTYRVRFVPRSTKTYTAAVLALKVKRTR